MSKRRALCLAMLPVLLGGGEAFGQGQVTTGNAFNPAISLILDGKLSSYDLDPEAFGVSGFLLDEEAGPPAEGFSLGESELTLSANIDDKFYGFATVALEQDERETEVELEEAWIQTLTLPYGLSVKAGKFFSDIGYHNIKHPHAWDFVDAPLAYVAMLGGTYDDTGVQFRWVAPTEKFVELGGELARGDDFPAGGGANDGTGAYALFARIGGDVGTNHSWRAGISRLAAEAEGRETALDAASVLAFTGDSVITILDAVWKWAERGNPRTRNFVVAAEYLHREEDGSLALAADALSEDGVYDGSQDGFYLYGVYQWRPKWRVGLRYDRLSSDNDVSGLTPSTPLDEDNRNPERWSAMVDWSNSEFGRLRLQVNAEDAGADSDTQLFVQYVMSLGAHGAHRF